MSPVDFHPITSPSGLGAWYSHSLITAQPMEIISYTLTPMTVEISTIVFRILDQIDPP